MEGWANTELLIVVALASLPREGACLIGAGLMGHWGGLGAQGATLAIPGDFMDGAGWVLCLASKLCCALGQLPVSSPCATERHGIQIFLGVFCKSQHLAEALRCCLFQLLPAEGMHRDVPILFSPVKRPLLSSHTEPWGCPLSWAMPSCAPCGHGEAALHNIFRDPLVPDLLW